MGGGDSLFPSVIPTEDDDESLLDHPQSFNSPLASCDEQGLSTELDIGQLGNDDSGLTYGGIQGSESDPPKSSIHEAAKRRQTDKVYAQIWRTYGNDVQDKIEGFEEARAKILSYTPGSWAENANGRDWDELDVPNTASLLLIGPKASGKSSLVNKISQVLEDGLFTSARAQVSNSTLTEDGTYFSYQYMIPRDSGSFCLCDTRGLSSDTCQNLKMLKRWRKKGVRHGELVKRESDSEDLKAQLKCKAKGLRSSSQRIPINFVIFVVNGLSVLEAMDGDDGRKRNFSQQIATIFNDPLLSFKDDKPVVVVTHGDLLSLSDRVRIRFYLGELLRIPPAQQIFDIPENNDTATKLTILDMLFYCLEHADRNLPIKKQQADTNLNVVRLAKIQIKEPWCAISLAVLLPILVLGLLLALSSVYQLPVNGSQSQGVQGCYPRSPTRESEENGIQDSYYHHAPKNQSQQDSAQASHPHEYTDASEKIGIQACLSCEPTVANSSNPDSLPTEKGAQENGLPTSTPLILSDKSYKDDIEAQTCPTMDGAQENDFPASRRHVPSDEQQMTGVQKEPVHASQTQASSNVPKKNGAQTRQVHVQTEKSWKDREHEVEWHKLRKTNGAQARQAHERTKKSWKDREDEVDWHKIRKKNGAQASQAHVRTKKSSKDMEDKVEWHKIRHFWSGDDDHHAPDKIKDIKVEWHKIRHLWSS